MTLPKMRHSRVSYYLELKTCAVDTNETRLTKLSQLPVQEQAAAPPGWMRAVFCASLKQAEADRMRPFFILRWKVQKVEEHERVSDEVA